MIENRLISIVIPTYNRSELLRGALKSLVCQETDVEFSYEIVAIDDCSTDTTSQVVSEVAGCSQVPIRYKRTQGKGYTEALNIGVKEASGEWIAFFDDDQLAERDWLKNLLDIALQKAADCVGGTICLDLPQYQLSHLGPVCKSILGEHTYDEKPARCKDKIIPSGGNILVSRKIFDSIGIFDTLMVTGGCDSDLVVRARAAGFDIWIAPNAIVHHVIPPYRLEYDYLRWVSLRWGIQVAYTDCKRFGCGKMLLLCIARIGQALFVNTPCLLFAYPKFDKAEILDRKCLLWRCVGYARKTLFLIAPRLFPQELFLARLEFRRERTSFTKSRGDFPVR